MGFFLFLLSQVLSFSATYCEQTGFVGKPCKVKSISCENLEARFSQEEVDYYKLRENLDSDFIRPLIKSESENVNMGTFSSSHKGSRRLRSKGYVTCSAIAIVNPDCDHASLSHFINVKPELLLSSQKEALEKDCKSSKRPASVTLVLSSRTDSLSGLNPLKQDGYYYQKLICEALRAFPEANFRVVHSKKNMGTEFDDMEIHRRAAGDFALVLERKSAGTQGLIQKQEFPFDSISASRGKNVGEQKGEAGSGF